MNSDETFYLVATREVESKTTRDPALWAKCLALSEGDKKKAKYTYIRQRVQKIKNGESAAPPVDTKQYTPSSPYNKEKEGTNDSPAPFLEKLANGYFGLAKTYWVYGFLVSSILNISFNLIKTPEVIAGLFLVYFTYSIPLIAGIWRASNKYQGPLVWGVLAKISAALSIPMIGAGIIGTAYLGQTATY